ncbi:MAG TPA: SEL1-like repeat protein [Verrucomicrobiales bacterium]|jgi:hypothetical protein|nr:SEL1-like repeat protein [Verrucomicrobiales bacterium]
MKVIVLLCASLLTLSAQESPSLPPALKEARELATKGDFAKALKLLQKEAEGGNAEATLAVGEFYLHGQGVKASAAEALKWFTRAADAGNLMAQFRQGRLLTEGADGVPKDEDKGRFLLNAAAEAGQPDAIARMGQLEEAAGDKADVTADRLQHFGEARRWYEKACTSNQPDALFGMVRMYDDGLDVPKDPAKATDFLFRAAKAGHLVAINEMGVRYQQGRGIRADNVAAVGWFLSAAESGLPAAMSNMGTCYETGNGVPQNFDRAGSWYAMGAKLNYPPAQYGLARLFENGQGTAKNPVYAYVNYTLAAPAIPEAAKKRDALKASLSATQLQEAAKLLSGKGATEKHSPAGK